MEYLSKQVLNIIRGTLKDGCIKLGDHNLGSSYKLMAHNANGVSVRRQIKLKD